MEEYLDVDGKHQLHLYECYMFVKYILKPNIYYLCGNIFALQFLEENPLPEGTYPILLSQKTQEKFECVAEWDLSALEPHIIVPIEKIREDLKDEESDFNNLKWKIEVCFMIILSI